MERRAHRKHLHGQIHSNDGCGAAHAGQVEGADAALELEVVHHRRRQRRRRVEGRAIHDQAINLRRSMTS